MEGRLAARLILPTLSVACALASGCASPPATPGPGAPTPPMWADDGSGRPVVGWVVRGDDYLGCRSAIHAVRSMERAHPGRLRLSVVYLGHDRPLLDAFLRRERVTAEVTEVRARRYATLFGRAPIPAVYVARSDTVRYVSALTQGTLPAGFTAAIRALMDPEEAPLPQRRTQ